MLDYYDHFIVLDRESNEQKNRIEYALGVLRDIEKKKSKNKDDIDKIHSIDQDLISDEEANYYTDSSATKTKDTITEKLKKWIKIAIQKLIHIANAMYEIIAKFINNILRLTKKKKASRNHKKDLVNVAKKNQIKTSYVEKINHSLGNVRITKISPIRVPGINKTFPLNSLKSKVDEVYDDGLYRYYTDKGLRDAVVEVQKGLIEWVEKSAKATNKFIKDIEKISNGGFKVGGLLDEVNKLERYIPDGTSMKVNSVVSLYRKKAKKNPGNGVDDVRDCLRFINDDIRDSSHAKNLIKRSNQTVSDVDSADAYLETDIFSSNMERVSSNLKKITDSKMDIFKATGDLDIDGVSRLLEIDEQIRKFIHAVYQGVTMINLISHLENRHIDLKEVIYNQKLIILGSVKGMHME